jgi:hypothetical protein
MFETKSGILFIAGLGFFLLAFVSNGVVPVLMYARIPEKTTEQSVAEQVEDLSRSRHVLAEFKDLSQRYPESFQQYFGEPTLEQCAAAVREGRKVYVAEGCWHCHSQFVRPVSNESRRWGPVSQGWEYQNELQRPVLFGTRRVGPDLSREGGTRSNDWHAVHFFRPRMTSPGSVMPNYPWFFDKDETGQRSPGKPNRRGLALITYMQWLGSWLPNYPHYDDPDYPPRALRHP